VALPSHLPRVEEVIEPDNITEGSKKIGEDVTEILFYREFILSVLCTSCYWMFGFLQMLRGAAA